MTDFKYFQRYVVPKISIEHSNLVVWSYTRVSSKDQYDNNSSVERQMEANETYAREHKYQITESFGGTYESAKSDFTRKEFKRLIEKVESSRKKPYAVLVYKMSRFSRSGGNAIGLVNTLVEDLGVNLIEVCSGISTTTERGKAAIYESLFHAYKENLEKKEIVIPSMIASLKAGNWMGITPVGYDHYGRKVRDERRFSFKQRIEINNDGELLREAWQWKASGNYSDAEIINRLGARGLKISKQKLSQLWRNPFYCGILINRLLDEPVAGNWPALVSQRDFIKVQQVLERNPSGFQHNRAEEKRPLTRLLKCNDCTSYMVGYKNKKKNLHYYRCLKCNGVSVNAFTTQRAQRKGANELFVDFLNGFRLPDKIAPLVKLQLVKLFERYNASQHQSGTALKSQLDNTEKRMKNLKIRYGLGDIDRETYELTQEHLNNQLRVIHAEFNRMAPEISNLENLIADALDKIGNLGQMWVSANLDGKRRLHKVLFPDGVYYDVKNHHYLTRAVNGFLSATQSVAEQYAQNKKWTFQPDDEKSNSAPPAGLEPATL